MRKQNFTLLALAMASAISLRAQCVPNGTTTRTWDGGGSTESFYEADNWSGNVVPDCDDNIVFNASSSKDCRMDASVQVNNITVASAYNGRISLEGNGNTLTANIVSLNGTYFQLGVETGKSTLYNLNVSNNGWFNAASKMGLDITNNLNIDLAGYFSSYYKSVQNYKNVSIDPYGQFKGPQEGTINLTGNFSKHKNSTYDHRKSTLIVNGDAQQTFNLSTGAGQTNGSCLFWNVILNKANETTNSTDNMAVNGGDTVLVENRMDLVDGDKSSGLVAIMDTLVQLGQGNQGHGGDFFFTGPSNGDLIVSGGNTLGSYDFIVSKATNTTPVNVWKGAATDILVQGRFTVNQGDLRFDEDVMATLNTNLTVLNNGTLTMPAANYLNLNDNFTATAASTINPRMGTLAFTGNGARTIDFGAPKSFYNIEFNTAATGSPVQPNGNDTIISTNLVTLKEGQISGGTGPCVLLVEGDLEALSSISDNSNWGHSIAFTGNGNSEYVAETGIPMGTGSGAAALIVNKSSASAKVTVVSGSATEATVGTNSKLTVQEGNLEFSGRASIASNNLPGIVVSGGTITAPASDTLFIRGAWDFYGMDAFTHNNGTVAFAGASVNTITHNNSAVKFNNVIFNSNHDWSWGASSGATTDTLWVEGDLTLVNSVLVRRVDLVFDGNVNLLGTADLQLDESAVAAGAGNQTITLGNMNRLKAEGLMINKSGGKVFLGSNMSLDTLFLKAGNIAPGANTLTVDGSNTIFGGNANSFIDGRLFITSGTWSGSRYLLPIGRGSNYRPVQLHNSSGTNNWDVEYVPNDTLAGTSTGTLNAVGNNEYWRINRNAGGNGAGAATYVELSILGKDGSWDDADVVVARWNQAGNVWNDYGQLVLANNRVMSSSTDFTSNVDRIFKLGQIPPAPVRVVTAEEISGNELALERPDAGKTIQIVPASALSFQVYPNPVSESLNLRIQGSDKGMVTLSDLNGKVIGMYNIAEVRSISVSNLAAGVYYASFTDGVSRIVQRVVKQ